MNSDKSYPNYPNMNDPIVNKRRRLPNPTKMRNLSQFKNMTDEQYAEYYSKMAVDSFPVEAFEIRIKAKMNELEADYDISDMKINDKLVLRALCQSMIQLEDLEQSSYKLRLEGIDNVNIVVLDKMGNLMNDLRNGISKMQDDLKITRKTRKGDKEVTVLNYIEDLKNKARKFYEQKMMYAFCPKCNMLLGTSWWHYPEDDRNKIAYYCHRKLDSGEECGEKVILRSVDMLENKGTNKPEILPESLR